MMRTMTVDEIGQVSGGLQAPNIGLFTDWRIALTAMEGWGAVAGAFAAGYAVGTFINDNTNIQGAIADFLE